MRRLHYLVTALLLLAAITLTRQTTSAPIVSAAPGLAAAFAAVSVAEAAAPAPASAPAVDAQPAASPATAGGMAILGPPTVTPELINRVLAEYRSPAIGTGQAIYDRGVQYGIDPAFLLAFFIHESSAGSNPKWAGIKPDGSTTHNVGNIVCTPGWRCHGRFRDYPSWDAGIEDWYTLMKTLYVEQWGRSTVETIIPKYAPASDNNNEAAYIQQVRRMVSTWRGQ
jgi:hypothetical protein